MEDRRYSSWLLERIAVGDIVRLRTGITTLGRTAINEIRINGSNHVSRLHAEIEISGDEQRIEIRDKQSTNGVFVNDKLFRESSTSLKEGDHIGIGVPVNYELNLEHPVYLLKHEPLSLRQARHVSLPENDVITLSSDEEIDEKPKINITDVSVVPNCIAPESTASSSSIATKTTNRNDHAKEASTSDNSAPKLDHTKEVTTLDNSATKLHVPIDTTIKQERVMFVSEAIQSIFGETDDVILGKMKDMNPFVYDALSGNPAQEIGKDGKLLVSGDTICLSSDEEECDKLPGAENGICDNLPVAVEVHSKSPNLFETSKENEDNIEPDNLNDGQEVDDVDEVDEIMYSQMIIANVKAELANDNSNEDNQSDHDLHSAIDADIKLEPFDDELNNREHQLTPDRQKQNEPSCWIISDDEDYDQELENKVSNWTTKLFSQSHSQAFFNASQVFDISSQDDKCEEDGLTSVANELDMEEDEFEEEEDFATNFYNRDKIINEMFQTLKEKIDGADKINKTVIVEQDSPVTKRRSSLTKRLSPSSSESESGGKNSCTTTKEESVCPPKSVPKKRLSMSTRMVSYSSGSESGEIVNETKPRKNLKKNFTHTKQLQDSSLESESETEIKESIAVNKKVQAKDEPTATTSKPSTEHHTTQRPVTSKNLYRTTPLIIDPPLLSRHRGKLRGVSASAKKAAALLKGTKCDQLNVERQTKWLDKYNVPKNRKQNSDLKVQRQERLKQIAEKQQSLLKTNETNDTRKRKLNPDSENSKKNVKVKMTRRNRGAFLAEESSKNEVPPFKIPKVTEVSTSTTIGANVIKNKNQSASSSTSTTSAQTLKTKTADTEGPTEQKKETFLHHLNKIDTVLLKNVNRKDANVDKKEMGTRKRRYSNKMTFASMQKNFQESHENQKKLERISCLRPCLSDMTLRNSNASRKKKTVRFNETPVVHYIDRTNSVVKKLVGKDVMPRPPMTTYNERRHLMQQNFPIIESTSNIITVILTWANKWLLKRNAKVSEARETYFPMPNKFTSFEQYKSIIIPLMGLEFLSGLEREYNANMGNDFKVSLSQVSIGDNKEHWLLFTKFNYQSKRQLEASKSDLVILDFGNGNIKTFAYVETHRKGAGTCYTIVFEILSTNITKKYLDVIKEIRVQPVVENVRVEFGAFNAVYQLAKTPLFQQILNPLQTPPKTQPQPKKKINYKGYDSLDNKQEQIVLSTYEKIIDESTPNISLIQGPPGTGKSIVITNLALQSLYGNEVRWMDKKILICAQSNCAVDVIAEKLFKISGKMTKHKFRIIRYGILEKMHPKVTPISLQKFVERDQLKKLEQFNVQIENKENLKVQILEIEAEIAKMKANVHVGTVEEDKIIEKQRQLQLMQNIITQTMRPEDERSIYEWYLTHANIVCATLASCVKLLKYVNYFDICIIDEATQCTESWTLLPLKFRINSLVLVGDTQQLPATVLSKKASDLGLGTSLFTRIQNCLNAVKTPEEKAAQNSLVQCLETQYRMHPELCKWPNMYFYKNILKNAVNTLQYKSAIVPFSILSLTYAQNKHCSNGKISNNLEAEFVVKLLQALDGYLPTTYNSYGIITPYAHQCKALNAALKSTALDNIMVNTIDSYQGIEKDVIIISNARTSGIGFLSNYQRLNVALTRPKKCLILCGNFKNLESVPAWRSLLNNARERKVFHDIADTDDIRKNVISKIKRK